MGVAMSERSPIREHVPPDAWILLDALCYALITGTLPPDEVPPPLVLTTKSGLLDELERTLFGTLDNETIATLDDQRRREWAEFRVARFMCRDEASMFADTY